MESVRNQGTRQQPASIFRGGSSPTVSPQSLPPTGSEAGAATPASLCSASLTPGTLILQQIRRPVFGAAAAAFFYLVCSLAPAYFFVHAYSTARTIVCAGALLVPLLCVGPASWLASKIQRNSLNAPLQLPESRESRWTPPDAVPPGTPARLENLSQLRRISVVLELLILAGSVELALILSLIF